MRRIASRRSRKIKNRLANEGTSEIGIEQQQLLEWSLTRRDPELTEATVSIIRTQLGYTPLNLIRIGACNEAMLPAIAVLYPLNANTLKGRYDWREGLKPFPTIFWMTCPQLHTKVADLEKDGWIQEIQSRLNDNVEDSIKLMEIAHNHYITERWNLLTDKDKVYIEEKGW
jgi:hypothetical protein